MLVPARERALLVPVILILAIIIRGQAPASAADGSLARNRPAEVLTSSSSPSPSPSGGASSSSSSSSFALHPPAVGQSSLVDKETGQVYWQGGPGSIRLSSDAIGRKAGVRHARATALTSLLALALLSALAARIREGLTDFAGRIVAASAEGRRRLHGTALAFVARVAAVLLWLPRFEPWFVVLTAALYLAESYFCSTRRYLENALSGPSALEAYVEELRRCRPVVTWKVRCFHYEMRKWLAWLASAEAWRKRVAGRRPSEDGGDGKDVNEEGDANPTTLAASILTRKVVTHSTSKQYKFARWSDNTVAGVWKRAQSPDLTAPFAKISLSKMLVLSDVKAREEYFAQQSEFVSKEGQRDDHAEFSTVIQVEGFRPKLLAIRPVEGTSSPKLFRIHLFWLFTLLGLTVPYRIWFSRHCDELHVTIVKETSAAAAAAAAEQEGRGSSSSISSWLSFLSQRSVLPPENNGKERRGEVFRKKMQQISLYGPGEEEEKEKGEEQMMEALVDLQDRVAESRQEDAGSSGRDMSSTAGPSPLPCITEGDETKVVEEEGAAFDPAKNTTTQDDSERAEENRSANETAGSTIARE